MVGIGIIFITVILVLSLLSPNQGELTTALSTAPTVIGHTGGVLGFGAWLYWIEGQDIVLAVTENVGTMHVGKAAPTPGRRVVVRDEFVKAASQLIDCGQAGDGGPRAPDRARIGPRDGPRPAACANPTRVLHIFQA